jgi:hypothetical protein
MAVLEKRIADLEAQAANSVHCVRVYFINQGDDAAEARLKAGIPLDYAGKLVCVEFVESRHPSDEGQYGNAE